MPEQHWQSENKSKILKKINYLAKKYNLSWNTVKKWKDSESVEDKTSRPQNKRTKKIHP
ncbi:MAG: hypothetical protein V1910_02145 [bacterium]